MNHRPNVISIQRVSTLRFDPTLTGEESIVLRALAVGRTDGQVCNDLQMAPMTYLLVMREMREKIGTAVNVSLIEWAKWRMKGVDQRIDKPDRCARPA